MQEIRKTLPHLDPLIAFEAAARHCSFSQAADELNVTASAVSQQIKALEQQLGVSLFERGHRSVDLTERGRGFQNSVTIALTHLVNAANDARAAGETLLEIATDTSIAEQWLIPRLPRFEALHPDISLKITVSDVRSELLGPDVPLSIIHGDGSWRGCVSELFLEEEVFPVCSPDYLARWGGEFKPEDLPRADLLDLDYEHWHWMNWAILLTEMSLPLPEVPRKLRMNNYPMLLDAAKRGLGMTLGWSSLTDDDLAAGRLVRPVEGAVKTRYAYYIVRPYGETTSPAMQAFRDWMLAERDAQLSEKQEMP